VSILSFLRKYGETEDPLFQDLPVETPPPDLGDAGSEIASPENLEAAMNERLEDLEAAMNERLEEQRRSARDLGKDV
jgi:hypothetical protein